MKGGRAGLQSSLCFWRLMTQLAALGCVSDILQTSSPASLPSTFCSLELIQCISDYYVMRQRGSGGWEGRRVAGGASGARGERAGRPNGWAGSGGCHSKYSGPPGNASTEVRIYCAKVIPKWGCGGPWRPGNTCRNPAAESQAPGPGRGWEAGTASERKGRGRG